MNHDDEFMKLLHQLVLVFLLAIGLIFVIGKVFAQEKLRSVRVKSGDCSTMAEGWTCYDEESMKKVDAAMKSGIECQVDLQKARHDIFLEKKPAKEKVPFYKEKYFQITAALVIGLGMGMGIGSTF